MGKILRIVIDILKPHEPDIVEVARQLSDHEGVEAVNIAIYEIDRKVENAKITVVGDDIPVAALRHTIQDLGGAIHSIDEVVAGAKLVEAVSTPQD